MTFSSRNNPPGDERAGPYRGLRAALSTLRGMAKISAKIAHQDDRAPWIARMGGAYVGSSGARSGVEPGGLRLCRKPVSGHPGL